MLHEFGDTMISDFYLFTPTNFEGFPDLASFTARVYNKQTGLCYPDEYTYAV